METGFSASNKQQAKNSSLCEPPGWVKIRENAMVAAPYGLRPAWEVFWVYALECGTHFFETNGVNVGFSPAYITTLREGFSLSFSLFVSSFFVVIFLQARDRR